MPIRILAIVFLCAGLASAQPVVPTTPAGRVVRIASGGNQAPLRAGIDNVRLIPIER